jgi:hypothetical protein
MEAIRKLTDSMSGVGELAHIMDGIARVSKTQLAFGSLQRQSEEWQRLLGFSTHMDAIMRPSLAFREAAGAWIWCLSQTMRRFSDLGLAARRTELSRELLVPFGAYTTFASDTQRLIEQCADGHRKLALTASVRLAEGQLLAMSEAVSAIAAVPRGWKVASAEWVLDAPVRQRGDLQSVPEGADLTDRQALVKFSPSACRVEKAIAVQQLVIQCMEAAELCGKEPVFKQTVRFLEAFGKVAWLSPTDRLTFGDFVDCLYFMFYEGAGKDNLRYRRAHGGVFDDAELEFVWHLKCLRNKWIRHDVEHGKEGDVRRSWRDLRGTLSAIGVASYPRTAQEYQMMHRALLVEAEGFLTMLLQRLAGGAAA